MVIDNDKILSSSKRQVMIGDHIKSHRHGVLQSNHISLLCNIIFSWCHAHLVGTNFNEAGQVKGLIGLLASVMGLRRQKDLTRLSEKL